MLGIGIQIIQMGTNRKLIQLLKNILKIVPWTLVILWMILIFSLSHQSAVESNKISKGITEVFVDGIEKVTLNSNFNISSFNHIIRKNAHFFLYLVLGMLVMNAIKISNQYIKRHMLLTVLICILYAILDELHQLFVPGRGAQIMDVFIDSVGASIGVLIYYVSYKMSKNKTTR